MLIDFCQCTLVGATLENKSALAELQFIVFCPHSMKIKSPTATHKNIKKSMARSQDRFVPLIMLIVAFILFVRLVDVVYLCSYKSKINN